MEYELTSYLVNELRKNPLELTRAKIVAPGARFFRIEVRPTTSSEWGSMAIACCDVTIEHDQMLARLDAIQRYSADSRMLRCALSLSVDALANSRDTHWRCHVICREARDEVAIAISEITRGTTVPRDGMHAQLSAVIDRIMVDDSAGDSDVAHIAPYLFADSASFTDLQDD